MSYWEWDRCKGAGEREQYLKSKLAECGPSAELIILHVIEVNPVRRYPTLFFCDSQCHVCGNELYLHTTLNFSLKDCDCRTSPKFL